MSAQDADNQDFGGLPTSGPADRYAGGNVPHGPVDPQGIDNPEFTEPFDEGEWESSGYGGESTCD